jgi:putative pyruvate formate lyase activating enzyme
MKCSLCPRNCQVERPESSGTAASLPGVCHAPQLAVVARAGLHFWEEPVISGERGSGTVFFSGCNLHCVYCQNHDISAGCRGKVLTAEQLRQIYANLHSQGAHNINLVTPTHFTETILASLDPLPQLPVVYNTNGYDLPSTLRRYEGKVSIYLPDLKYADNDLGWRYSGVKDYFERTTAAIDEMYRQTGSFEIDDDGIMRRGVIIRHLMLPGQLENTLRVIRYVAEHFRPGQVMFSLMRQYLPCGKVSETEFPELNRRISDAEYLAAENALFDSGIEDGFLQDAAAADKEFIPAFDGTGVD